LLEGKNKSLNEQIKILTKILKKSKNIMLILEILENYSKENHNFKNYYLGGGSINQTVFNYYHNYNLDYGIKDYDISFYMEDTSYEAEDVIIKDLMKDLDKLNLEFDIKNQKRVPIWYKEKYGKEKGPYLNVEDAISKWGSTVTCLGVRLENKKLIVCAPYGLNDLFSLTIKPVKLEFYKEGYIEKTTRWKKTWPNLEIKEWDE
jgi:hypothetical protein